MIKKLKFLFFSFSLVFLEAVEPFSYSPPFSQSSPLIPQNESSIVINNYALAKVNGKVISLLDVVKKMDLFLYEFDASLKLSNAEKIQFYTSRWEETLEEMICSELSLLEAEQKELKVSDGQVREELERRFGPYIMENLEKIPLQYEETRQLIRNELLLQQMMWHKVHAKVLQTVTPQVVKQAYQEYLKKNPPTTEWNYRVFSIRGGDKKISQEVANKAHLILTKEGKNLEEVKEELQEKYPSTLMNVSDLFSKKTSSISKQHLEGIQNLSTTSYSEPISQYSRVDQRLVFRIFYLESLKEHSPEDFEAMHDKLKNQLLNHFLEKEKKLYYKNLKKKYHLEQTGGCLPLPEGYQPFFYTP